MAKLAERGSLRHLSLNAMAQVRPARGHVRRGWWAAVERMLPTGSWPAGRPSTCSGGIFWGCSHIIFWACSPIIFWECSHIIFTPVLHHPTSCDSCALHAPPPADPPLHALPALQLEGPALQALAMYCKDSLEELDVSWCRKLSNEALGHLVGGDSGRFGGLFIHGLDVSWLRALYCVQLGAAHGCLAFGGQLTHSTSSQRVCLHDMQVDSCPNLRRLAVWGCTQLTATFLLGHSNEGLEVLGRGEALLPVPPV